MAANSLNNTGSQIFWASGDAKSSSGTDVSAGKSAAAAKPKRLSQAEQRELDGMLDAIGAAEKKVEALQARLADPATYQGDGTAVAAVRAELAAAQAEVERLTTRWESLESRAALTTSR